MPIKTKNSPIKPVVPGNPRPASTKIISMKENLGTILIKPPYDLIIHELTLS